MLFVLTATGTFLFAAELATFVGDTGEIVRVPSGSNIQRRRIFVDRSREQRCADGLPVAWTLQPVSPYGKNLALRLQPHEQKLMHAVSKMFKNFPPPSLGQRRFARSLSREVFPWVRM